MLKIGDAVQVRPDRNPSMLTKEAVYTVVEHEGITGLCTLSTGVGNPLIPNIPQEWLELMDTSETMDSIQPQSALQGGTGRGYKDLAIQPIELSMKNNLNACQHTAIKYLIGYNIEGGKGKADLIKARHTIDLLIELENL